MIYKRPVKKTNWSDELDNKDKESIYYKEIRDLINKKTFVKRSECTFKIYNIEFSVKGTNGKDYPILKNIWYIK